ncbi:MAG TPA: carbohydrate kinase family protein [Mycobacteriales bacterium]|nr:carbohydrate kinase family protein [Mycobacteriales bacterium]HVX69366.1 carbohydrate kinase family protein [Mycobacteriales bacterium]
MRIAVSGSIATDHLMTFAGRFSEQLLPDQLSSLSVSFLVDELDVRRGGVAANICFGLGTLGLSPVMVGAVGSDFGEYREWLERHGVDTSGVTVSANRHTARFVCTTDADQNQIASFYPGAMSEAVDIDLADLGRLDLVLISPNAPEAMVAHAAYCRDHGVAFAADPSQQLASLEREAIVSLLDGAQILFNNAYEAALLESKTGMSAEAVLAAVGTRVTTHGADGAVIQQTGEADIRVPVVPADKIVDPTGVGDAFRAGFLAARSWGLGLERAAQLGSLLATYCLESLGPQEYALDAAAGRDRLAAAYGADAAAEIAAHL